VIYVKEENELLILSGGFKNLDGLGRSANTNKFTDQRPVLLVFLLRNQKRNIDACIDDQSNFGVFRHHLNHPSRDGILLASLIINIHEIYLFWIDNNTNSSKSGVNLLLRDLELNFIVDCTM